MQLKVYRLLPWLMLLQKQKAQTAAATPLDEPST